MLEVLDTYYTYVYNQMQVLNAQQAFGGLAPARDWPQTTPQDGALYLLHLGSESLREGTTSQELFIHYMQWTLFIIGTDLAQGQVGQNRGDWRNHMTLQENLRNANYPGWTPKTSFVASPSGAVQPFPVGQPGTGIAGYQVQETIWWTKLKFKPRYDKTSSGLIYGAAAVDVFAYEDASVAVAS
jgi:hypothetical protein